MSAFLALALQIPGVNVAYAAVPTKFSYKDGVSNTRHNLTQRPVNGIGPTMPWWMDGTRNDYGEVCVYCHTPHGANANVTAPLWSRTLKATTYDQLGSSTLTQTVSQPGIASLVCLSCHDGQTAVDSIINMPGSGCYNAGQATAENTAFLDAWDGIGPTGTPSPAPGPRAQPRVHTLP
ncbi:MAG: hypothetical protein OEV15_03250 [Gallionella sp.]|nr:hypothetical protein [Gallionella sp.]